MTEDPLDQLFVSDDQLIGDTRTLLAKMIAPFAVIRTGSSDVAFKDEADALSARHKILIVLLCRLVVVLKNGPGSPQPATPKDIELATGLPGGTVRPRLKGLYDEKIAAKNGEGYWIQQSNVKRAFRELEPVLPKA